MEDAIQALHRVNRTLNIFGDCCQKLMHVTDESLLLHQICQCIVKIGGYRFAWVGFAEQDERKMVRSAAHAGHDNGYLATANITWADTERGRGPTGRAIRTSQACIARNTQTDPDIASDRRRR